MFLFFYHLLLFLFFFFHFYFYSFFGINDRENQFNWTCYDVWRNNNEESLFHQKASFPLVIENTFYADILWRQKLTLQTQFTTKESLAGKHHSMTTSWHFICMSKMVAYLTPAQSFPGSVSKIDFSKIDHFFLFFLNLISQFSCLVSLKYGWKYKPKETLTQQSLWNVIKHWCCSVRVSSENMHELKLKNQWQECWNTVQRAKNYTFERRARKQSHKSKTIQVACCAKINY